ncbi:MAG: protoheme IX farnesyltransferase [Bacteroidia bacterium]|nr:MAG: protoheme IX farnesyltransferase [Bacteroidia bacterium]
MWVRNFLSITKPGIIFGNLITVIGGFLLAARGQVNYLLFIMTLIGISLTVASGCVINNYIDRDIDRLMERTKNRVLALGLMSNTVALLYGGVLGAVGLLLLMSFTNLLTTTIAFIGLVVYVVIYSLWLKRTSVYGTLVGSISGAVPPVVGYCAVRGKIDLGACILFLVLCLWQMPHSFAIAIYRYSDYARASIAILPVKKGIYWTKICILLYIIGFVIASLLLTFCGYTGYIYLGVMLVMGIYWIKLATMGFKQHDDRIWARKIFIFSILIIMIFSVMMSINYLAPDRKHSNPCIDKRYK